MSISCGFPQSVQANDRISPSSGRSSFQLFLLWDVADSRSAGEEIVVLVWNAKVRCRVHISPPVDPVLSQVNPICILTLCFFKMTVNIIPASTPRCLEARSKIQRINLSVRYNLPEWQGHVVRSEKSSVRFSNGDILSLSKYVEPVLLLFLFSFYRFFLVLFLLNQWWTPPLRLQVSDCSTFLIKCYVPSTAVFVENLLNTFLVLFPDNF
jgi:hypothetical protein